MRRIHSPKSWISVPVAPPQPSVHEDVLSVAAQCYTDPVKNDPVKNPSKNGNATKTEQIILRAEPFEY